MKIKNIFLIITFLSIYFGILNKLWLLNNKKNQPQNKSKNYKIYKKRRWCPKNSDYRYINQIKQPESTIKNYFKVFYSNKHKITLESSYENKNTPHGTWFYYNKNRQIVEAKTYKKGIIKEQKLLEYNKNKLKTKETHYIFKDNKKKLRSQSRWIYKNINKDKTEKLKKIEHFNAGILDEFIELIYNKKSLVKKTMLFHFDRRLKSYNIYSYNKNNLKSKEEIYNSLNQKQAKIIYKYKKNKISKKLTYTINNNKAILEKQINYFYNKKNNLIKKTEQILINKKLQKLKEEVFKFDSHSCIKCRKIIDQKARLIYKKGEC